MTYAPAVDVKLEDMGLRPIPAPPEPRVRYTEPHLSNVESLALIRGRTFFVSDRTGNLMPPGAPHVGLFREDTRYLKIGWISPAILSGIPARLANINRYMCAFDRSDPPQEAEIVFLLHYAAISEHQASVHPTLAVTTRSHVFAASSIDQDK
jgi:hypothetical protein